MTLTIHIPASERVRRGELFAQVDRSLGPGATVWRVVAVGRPDRNGLLTARLTSVLVPLGGDQRARPDHSPESPITHIT